MSFSAVTLKLLEGFGSTCLLFLFTLILALPLGLVLGLLSMTKVKPIKWIVDIFIWVIRGTPLMLQLFVIFFIPGLVFGVQWPTLNTASETFNTLFSSRFIAALVAFVINYACYFAVIYRGGIQSIPKGQYEAAYMLGMTKTQAFRKIILPQVLRHILAPMSNEIITLVKDTSLARVIAVVEITSAAYTIMSVYALIWPLFYTGVFYLLFVGVLTIIFNRLEKRFSYYKV